MEYYVEILLVVCALFFSIACLIVHRMKRIQPISDISLSIAYSGISYVLSMLFMVVVMNEMYNKELYTAVVFSLSLIVFFIGCLILITVIYLTESINGAFDRLMDTLFAFNLAASLSILIVFVLYLFLAH